MRAIEQAQLLQRKAAQDLAVLRKLIGDPAISDETLGFHAQQAAEKLIKALLALGGHEYPRTHDLGLLLDLLASLDVQIPEAHPVAWGRGRPQWRLRAMASWLGARSSSPAVALTPQE